MSTTKLPRPHVFSTHLSETADCRFELEGCTDDGEKIGRDFVGVPCKGEETRYDVRPGFPKFDAVTGGHVNGDYSALTQGA